MASGRSTSTSLILSPMSTCEQKRREIENVQEKTAWRNKGEREGGREGEREGTVKEEDVNMAGFQ